MTRNLRQLLGQIQQLETAVAAQLRQKERQYLYDILNRKVTFKAATIIVHKAKRMSHRRFWLESTFMSLLTSPVIYAFAIPGAFLDLCTTVYQAIIFPVYGIEKVKRSDYIAFDRGQLHYLNWLERFNCDYCGYVNGLIGYAREVASRTEHYFCPIKHAIKELGVNPLHAHYLAYGDAAQFHAKLDKLRKQLHKPVKARL